MERMIGNVEHKIFGKGTIKSVEDKIITVNFNGVEKKFQYPAAFVKYLTAEDRELQERLEKINAKPDSWFVCGTRDGGEEYGKDPKRLFRTKEEAFSDLKRRIHEFYLEEKEKKAKKIVNFPEEEAFYQKGSEDPENVDYRWDNCDVLDDDELNELDNKIHEEEAYCWYFSWPEDESALELDFFDAIYYGDDEVPFWAFYIECTPSYSGCEDIDWLLREDSSESNDMKKRGHVTKQEWIKWVEEGHV